MAVILNPNSSSIMQMISVILPAEGEMHKEISNKKLFKDLKINMIHDFPLNFRASLDPIIIEML